MLTSFSWFESKIPHDTAQSIVLTSFPRSTRGCPTMTGSGGMVDAPIWKLATIIKLDISSCVILALSSKGKEHTFSMCKCEFESR